MNVNFRNDICSNSMVIENAEDFRTEDFSVRILSNNRIKGLLPMDYETVNGRVNIIFDTSGRQTLDCFYKTRKISYSDYKNLVYSLTQTIKNVKEYLLDVNNIILKKEYIFINTERQNVEFCYYPYYAESITDGIRELFSGLLSLIDYGDPRVVRIAYDAQKAAVTANFTMDEIITAISRAASEIDSSYSEIERKREETDNVFNETQKDYNQPDKTEKIKANRDDSTFFEKAQIYFSKKKDPGELFDDLNELKIFRKIKNVNADADDTNDKRKSHREEAHKETRKNDGLPDGIAEMAEDLNKSGFFEEYRMI